MEKKPITVEELQEWMNDTFTLYACSYAPQGKRTTCRLTLSVNPERIFRVEMKGEIKYIGGDEEWAVRLFNDLSSMGDI